MVDFSQQIFQVIPQYSDGNKRFSDNLDRLYITTRGFNNDKLFTDDVVNATGSILKAIDKSSSIDIPEIMTGSQRIKLFWRTVVQFMTTTKDQLAAGFRLFAYPTGILIIY